MADKKTASVTLPSGTKVTCSEEQAKRYAESARPKTSKSASSKTEK